MITDKNTSSTGKEYIIPTIDTYTLDYYNVIVFNIVEKDSE